ncbi:branched-chain-amino-acid aminotransferase-like protein 1 [Anneissia japonica]|uniref:branched-chain-amino-acid aminotransferase-like protein 1 n=1 Tax=Anneissia japonica TaxID=1529436 RepID=UPI001425B65F|nr:branched-chain-amino-acid aminotransferase-like protein 1 [Anneissia japonica]XP_033120329.1 branched-chain-amino-acid aminotransferase-like protein 1 [Anneissia japonica]
MSGKQVRILLWCVPRSVSTAFVMSMGNLDDVKIINEPYISAFRVGPDIQDRSEAYKEMTENMQKITAGVEVNCKNALESGDCSYEYIKENILEAEYPGKKVVIAKDMSYAISEQLHMLPKGYRHAFLIRNPAKVFPSYKKLLDRFTQAGKEAFLEVGKNKLVPEYYAFGESWKLYEYLTKTGIEPKPFVMDADDLLENPEYILRQFCSYAGIKYTDKLLAWDGGDDVTKHWTTSKAMLQRNKVTNYHKKAFESKGFGKPSLTTPTRSEMSEDVVHCIDESHPFYEKLYELRTKVNRSTETKIK